MRCTLILYRRPSEDTFSGPAVDNETALRDGCTGAVYTKPILEETLFLVFLLESLASRNQEPSLTPGQVNVQEVFNYLTKRKGKDELPAQ